MAVLLMPSTVPDAERSRRQVTRACTDLALAIDAATTPAEALAIWMHCQSLTQELRTLTLRAALRCKELEP
jgi:hypothetical protein